jgi:hypothetical protein
MWRYKFKARRCSVFLSDVRSSAERIGIANGVFNLEYTMEGSKFCFFWVVVCRCVATCVVKSISTKQIILS